MPNKQKLPTTCKFILYRDVKTHITINVRFEKDDVWLTQAQIATLFDTRQQNVSYHIKTIIKEGELLGNPTYKEFLLVQQEGKRTIKRQIMHYNMDMIIAIGYRIKSPSAKHFRQWVMKRSQQRI